MNRKKYSDNNTDISGANNKPSFIQELKNDLGPAYKRKAGKFKSYIKANPKRVLLYMFVILILNTAVLFFFTRQYKGNSFHYTDLKLRHDGTAANEAPDIPFTWHNYTTLTAIKDTLEYLMNKQQLSKHDTLTFIRIATSIEKLDPGFVQRLKQQAK